MILFCTSVQLLFIPHAKWYRYTEAEIQSTILHLIELLSRQFLGNSPKIKNQLFFKNFIFQKPDISLKSVPQQG